MSTDPNRNGGGHGERWAAIGLHILIDPIRSIETGKANAIHAINQPSSFFVGWLSDRPPIIADGWAPRQLLLLQQAAQQQQSALEHQAGMGSLRCFRATRISSRYKRLSGYTSQKDAERSSAIQEDGDIMVNGVIGC